MEEERGRELEIKRRWQARLEQPNRTAGATDAPDCNRSGTTFTVGGL